MDMKTKDILTITTVAFGTAVLTAATLWPGPMEAGIDAPAPLAKIAQPRLACHGMELTVAISGGRTFKAGEPPEFELTAVNKTDEAASAKVCVSLDCSAPANPLSRVIVMPKLLWQQEKVLTLRARETKVFALRSGITLPPNSVISVRLRNLDSDRMISAEPLLASGLEKPQSSQYEIVALSFSTLVPPLPAVASLKLAK